MKRTTSEELLDTPKSLLVVSTDFDEEKYETFVANVRLKLSDVRLCRLEDGLYVSLMSVVSLKDFVIYRGEYCKRCHNSHCTECIVLINMASYILKEGVAKVSEVFKMQFPNKIYKSDKAVQRLLQLPVVIVKGEFLFVTEKRPDVNYKILLELLPKMLPAEKEVGSRISKETLRTLCQLASTESDRKLLKYIATWGQSAKQAKLAYGIDDNVRKVQQVNQAMLMANEIQKSVMELATLEDTALLNSLGVPQDISSESESDGSDSETDYFSSNLEPELELKQTTAGSNVSPNLHGSETPPNEVCLSWLKESKFNWFSFHHECLLRLKHLREDVFDELLTVFANNLSASGLNDDELAQVQGQAFTEYQRRQPLMIDGEAVFSESDSEEIEDHDQEFTQWCENGKKRIQSVRRAIKQKAKRTIAKEIATRNVLKRKCPKRASRIVKEHPNIGRDIEEFVKSKRVGADAWRRTGVLTFDGARSRGKKVTYKSIQCHLQEKYSCKISYGTVVQLCVIRSKRRLSAKRYKGIAKVTCRRARKGFAVKLNVDAHWSSAFYKGIDFIQLKDGKDKVLLNRDDQAGFRLDTTFTHKQGKCITLESQPSLTTRTDFVNKYPSLLQTTSYLFLDSETTEKACVGIVKPHFTYDKTPTQHYIDLNMLETKLPNYLIEKPIDCIRVDGAGDEGPAHLEVQFLWTERHILKQKICTIITTRNSGGSYLNPVELMNGCIAKAHANLYIPSTLAGGNFSGSGLDADKLTENMDLATDVYIDRVNGAPCCGTNIQLFKGGKDPSLVERREALLIFLRGNPKKKDELKAASPTLYQHFERVWSVRQSHMDHKVPAQYAFILTLCYKPECSHPLCHGATREQCWFENGPPLSYIPFPIPDPERPWGGSCEECSGMCSGHYLKPLAHWGYVKDRAYDTAEFQYKPPSAVIKERFYDSLKQGKEMLNIDLESVAKQVLLSVDEVSMQVEHLKGTMERRKMGAQKAALTRKNKKAVSKCLIMLILRLKQVTYS